MVASGDGGGGEGEGAILSPLENSTSLPDSSNFDDMKPRISWRGDGDYFAVSVFDASNGCRTLRVFDRDCVLQASSEPLPRLEPTLSWK